MLEKLLFLLCLWSAWAEKPCEPDAVDGLKVRFSIRTALGARAYVWNENEMFLFRATVAYAMRKHMSDLQFEASNVVVCGETRRVSFWFVVTSPLNTTRLIKKVDVDAAMSASRHRINGAFLLSDTTLEFMGISPTLAAPLEPAPPPWLIAFGSIMSVAAVCIAALLASLLVRRKRGKEEAGGGDARRLREKNGTDEGVYSTSFSHHERMTQM